MSGDPQFHFVAVPAVILVGLAKGGFSGLGTLGVPLLSLVVSPVRAAAIVLPILIVQDWVSVWAFRRDYSTAQPRSSSSHPRWSASSLGWLLAARSAKMLCDLRSG